MFKKAICTAICCALALLTFTSCTGSENQSNTLKDGEYRAEFKDYDDHGWKEYVVIHVSDGKYTNVEFDAVNKEDGRKKSEDADYLNAYPKDADFVKPDEYTKLLEDDLIEKQDIEKVDIIATATTSSNGFKKLVSALQTNMRRGKTDTVIVEGE